MLQQTARRLSDADLLAELARIAKLLGRERLNRQDIRAHSTVGTAVFTSRFGSLRAALGAAGLQSSPMANRWTDEDCFANLDRIRSHYGRMPRRRELDRPPSQIAGSTYGARFGSWDAALQAYARRLSESDGGPAQVSLPKRLGCD